MSGLFRRRQHARSGAAFVAAVVLLCQATAWVHAAATPHVTCLEHGESVHLAVGVRASAQAPGTDIGGSGLVVASEALEAETHAHDHCALQGPRTTSAPTPDPSFVRTALLVVVAPVVAPAPPPVLLLSFAPKTSPPRTPAA